MAKERKKTLWRKDGRQRKGRKRACWKTGKHAILGDIAGKRRKEENFLGQAWAVHHNAICGVFLTQPPAPISLRPLSWKPCALPARHRGRQGRAGGRAGGRRQNIENCCWKNKINSKDGGTFAGGAWWQAWKASNEKAGRGVAAGRKEKAGRQALCLVRRHLLPAYSILLLNMPIYLLSMSRDSLLSLSILLVVCDNHYRCCCFCSGKERKTSLWKMKRRKNNLNRKTLFGFVMEKGNQKAARRREWVKTIINLSSVEREQTRRAARAEQKAAKRRAAGRRKRK